MQRLLILLCMATAVALVTAFPVLAEESAPGIELRLQHVVATGSDEAVAKLEIDNLGTSLKAFGATLNVPAPWEVADVQGLGTAGIQNVRFLQKGRELRILLVSLQGAIITSEDGPLLELHLRKPVGDPHGLRDLGKRLALVDAEMIDEQGDPLTVRLPRESPFARELGRRGRLMRGGIR